ncbi:hypothetical protein G9A89_006588 [Geosiphon pyriformis]|nr:hypothetical protein G9A89_006588 [Geosiphon pyriformis]
MAYAPITKLDNFTGEKDDAQAITANGWNNAQTMQAISYFLKDTANSWYQSLINKPQDFNAFKVEFLRYFSNNNSINRLVNTFTTMKQEETEAVTTYLGCFYQNLCQIQAIDANYFTAPQIFSQFIHGLCSSILDFESIESETNHTQAINLVMNGSSELDSKLKQFRNVNYFQNQSCPLLSSAASNQLWQPETRQQSTIGKSISKPQLQISNSELLPKLKSNYLSANDAVTNLSTTSISTSNLSTTPPQNSVHITLGHLRLRLTQNWRSAMVVHQLISSSSNSPLGSHSRNSGTDATQNPNFLNYLSLLVTPEDATSSNLESDQQTTLINNISPAIVTNDRSLAAIFFFELEEPSQLPLFSGATFKEKLITAMYTNVKVDRHSIKLIFDSSLTGSIITKQLMDQLGH